MCVGGEGGPRLAGKHRRVAGGGGAAARASGGRWRGVACGVWWRDVMGGGRGMWVGWGVCAATQAVGPLPASLAAAEKLGRRTLSPASPASAGGACQRTRFVAVPHAFPDGLPALGDLRASKGAGAEAGEWAAKAGRQGSAHVTTASQTHATPLPRYHTTHYLGARSRQAWRQRRSWAGERSAQPALQAQPHQHRRHHQHPHPHPTPTWSLARLISATGLTFSRDAPRQPSAAYASTSACSCLRAGREGGQGWWECVGVCALVVCVGERGGVAGGKGGVAKGGGWCGGRKGVVRSGVAAARAW